MRIVFMGTPEFAVPTLERAVEAGHEVLAVVTQPDRPAGRGRQVSAPPVKHAALRLGLPVQQPEKIRTPEAYAFLSGLGAEAMVVVGYGKIIPQAIIDLPSLGIINVHASLLPKYRGAAPIQWAVANGEVRTGVTTMRIDAGLDTGDMLLKAETEIGPDETALDLSERLAQMGADLLVRTLEMLRAGTLEPQPQDDAQATFAPVLKKEDGLIDWRKPAIEIHNRVRGLLPWPACYTTFRGRLFHIWKARPSGQAAGEPGSLRNSRDGAVVACGGGSGLELVEVQLEGKNRMPAASFLNGQHLEENERLGEVTR
ncbi:MAG TPA: methionyl-tRNA formyltransferase [Bryobacteraceae bacterium]|nr:methionyl-tRNA formyltransferase [Bryobacteraceae bacterium]